MMPVREGGMSGIYAFMLRGLLRRPNSVVRWVKDPLLFRDPKRVPSLGTKERLLSNRVLLLSLSTEKGFRYQEQKKRKKRPVNSGIQQSSSQTLVSFPLQFLNRVRDQRKLQSCLAKLHKQRRIESRPSFMGICPLNMSRRTCT